MKLNKSIIAEIKKHEDYLFTEYQIFYKCKYMDDTVKTHMLSFTDYERAVSKYHQWFNPDNDCIIKEAHTVLLEHRAICGSQTLVLKYNQVKNLTTFGEDFIYQKFDS